MGMMVVAALAGDRFYNGYNEQSTRYRLLRLVHDDGKQMMDHLQLPRATGLYRYDLDTFDTVEAVGQGESGPIEVAKRHVTLELAPFLVTPQGDPIPIDIGIERVRSSSRQTPFVVKPRKPYIVMGGGGSGKSLFLKALGKSLHGCYLPIGESEDAVYPGDAFHYSSAFASLLFGNIAQDRLTGPSRLAIIDSVQPFAVAEGGAAGKEGFTKQMLVTVIPLIERLAALSSNTTFVSVNPQVSENQIPSVMVQLSGSCHGVIRPLKGRVSGSQAIITAEVVQRPSREVHKVKISLPWEEGGLEKYIPSLGNRPAWNIERRTA